MLYDNSELMDIVMGNLFENEMKFTLNNQVSFYLSEDKYYDGDIDWISPYLKFSDVFEEDGWYMLAIDDVHSIPCFVDTTTHTVFSHDFRAKLHKTGGRPYFRTHRGNAFLTVGCTSCPGVQSFGSHPTPSVVYGVSVPNGYGKSEVMFKMTRSEVLLYDNSSVLWEN